MSPDSTVPPASTDPSASLQNVWLLAHDLKNAFSLMTNVFEDLQQHLVVGDASRRSFTEVRWILSHVDSVANALLDSVRDPSIDRTAVSIGDLLISRESVLKRVLTPGVSLTVRPTGANLLVLATVPELDRLLFALVSNACKAMPNGGDLTISSGWLDHVSGATHPSVRPRRYVRLTVSDTGEGVDRDTHMNLLENFPDDSHGAETARENVVSVVRRLHGWVMVESEERAGTRVHVCLPVIADLSGTEPSGPPDR
jgi:signal transduction histidine kinase